MTIILQWAYNSKMAIPIEHYAQRTKLAKKIWVKMYRLYTEQNMDPRDIAKKFRNKRTGKPYSREHVYACIKRVREILAQDKKGS